MEGVQQGGGVKHKQSREEGYGEGNIGEADEESYQCSTALFSEQSEAMQELNKQERQQKGVWSDLQIRKIILDAGWNELATENMVASRLFKNSQKQSRTERLYPELVGVGEMKSSRNTQETPTGSNQENFLTDGWIWSE